MDRADALLAHRGPDGSGRHADARCQLVHRRLALIDLSPTGAQPMASPSGDVQVVFNGEIYNHRELRDELVSQGHCFRGSSDTEVLVHLYAQEGEALAARLHGMFALALYDRRRGLLLLARDRFGIKPLYHARFGEELVFASELKALLCAKAAVTRVDRQACYDFLGLGYVPEPATGLEGIQALPPGTTLVLDRDGERPRTVETPRAGARGGRSLDDVVAETETALLRAVRRQSVADVPVGALLSGGIDSSLVVAALCRGAGGAPRTFNAEFPDPTYDETRLARAVATHYATRHQTVAIDPPALTPDAVLGLLRHFDQPFGDSSLIPTYLVARSIRDRGIVCALSGDGGDEIFGGYNSHWQTERLVQLMRLPSPAQALLHGIGRLAAPLTRNLGRQLARAMTLVRDGAGSSAALLSGLASYLSTPQKHAIVRREAREGLQEVDRLFDGWVPAGTQDVEELSRRLTDKFLAISLPSHMLRKVDMMSMKAGVEVRVPMLDEDLVGVGLSLTHRLKTDGHRGKVVLRALASRWLPPEVVHHPKHGFDIPLDRLASAPFHDMLHDLLLAPRAAIRDVLDVTLVARWLDRFRRAGTGRAGGRISRLGLGERILFLLSLELFLRDWRLSW